MLGVIVECASDDGNVKETIFERVSNRTTLERVVTHALQSELAQMVTVSSPVSIRTRITGGGAMMPGLRPDLESLRRRATLIYGGAEDTLLDRLYYSMLKSKMDKAIIIHGDCPMIEAWLINEYARQAYLTKNPIVSKGFGKGFEVTVLTFSAVADAFIYAPKRESIEDIVNFIGERHELDYLENVIDSESYITFSEIDLRFNNIDQRTLFEYLLEELDKKADVNDLIGDASAEQKENEQ